MFLKIVHFVVLEGITFFAVAIGAFILAHVGLMLIGQLDAFVSRDRRGTFSGGEAEAKFFADK